MGELVTHHTVVGVVLGVALFVSGCSEEPVNTADSALASHFLDPLQSADINYAIENTCHLQRDSDTEPWHLEVTVQIDGDRDRVAQVLKAEDVVLGRDRMPDGNERVGYLCALEFVARNGGTWSYPQMIRTATSP